MPWPVASRNIGFISLAAATATGAGKSVSVAGSRSISLQVVLTGNPLAYSVDLEGTLDDLPDSAANWFPLGIFTGPSGSILFVDGKPVARVRANLQLLAGGNNPTVTAKIGSL